MKKILMFVSCIIMFTLCSCMNVNKNADSEKEALRISKLPTVNVWVFDSLKCPFSPVVETDSVKNLVEWYSFAPTTKRVFAINTNSCNERVFPQADVLDYEKSFDTLSNKTVRDVRLIYVSPYNLDAMLSPVKVNQCKWWYRKSGNTIFGYAYIDNIFTVVSHHVGSVEYSLAYLRTDGWKLSFGHPFSGEQKSNIESVKQAISLTRK